MKKTQKLQKLQKSKIFRNLKKTEKIHFFFKGR